MKRILMLGLFVVFGGLAVQATPWGIHAGDDIEVEQTTPDNYFHIIRKVVAGQPIHIFLSFEEEEEDSDFYRAEYEEFLRALYNRWFEMVIYYIQDAHAQPSFPFLMKRLEKGIDVQFVSSFKQADLQVFVSSSWPLIHQHCSNSGEIDANVMGCVSRSGPLPVLYTPKYDLMKQRIESDLQGETIREGLINEYFFMVNLHEVGHTLGLSDQNPVSAAPEIISHPIYRSTQLGKGIMSGALNFSCDDADGMINLLEAVRSTEPSRRKGWKSLCPKSQDVYVDGISKLAGPYAFEQGKENWIVITYKNGKKEKTERFPVVALKHPLEDIPDRRIVEMGELGRPMRAEGPNGEIIYYQYNYTATHRLITQDGKALRWEMRIDEKENNSHYEAWQFRVSDGQMGYIATQIYPNEVSSDYVEGPRENPLVHIRVSSQGMSNEKVEFITGQATQSRPAKAVSTQDKIDRAVQRGRKIELADQVKQWTRKQEARWQAEQKSAH